MGKYFGTDGFRGEANKNLTVEHAFKVGRFLGWYYGQEHRAKVVIGKDTRRSSYMFEYALVAGLTASGADAYLLHVTTTPSVSYVIRTEASQAAVEAAFGPVTALAANGWLLSKPVTKRAIEAAGLNLLAVRPVFH